MHLDSIISRFTVPPFSYGVCDDRTGDYVYFASDWLVAVDTRTDSIVSGVHLPLQYASSLVPNRKTNRFYIAGGYYDNAIQVVYDSVIFAGLQAGPRSPGNTPRAQTLLNRNKPLRCITEGTLFDASGRRVAVLRSGPNNIGHLAPGVYFVREEPQAVSHKPQAIRKVVVTR
jgi:hypothetical protein